MNRIWHSAPALLLLTGGLLGVTPPLGKVAAAAGLSPILWSFVISFGTAAVLLGVLFARRERLGLNAHRLRYFVVAALVSYAIPNVLMFSVIPRLGAGYTGIMLTVSPLITLMLSLLLGVRRPNRLGIAGITLGFVGATLVAATRGEVGQPADPVWISLGLLIPVSLAAGNIYRTADWPPGAGPIELAVGSHLASAAMLLLVLLLLRQGSAFAQLRDVPILTLVQVLAGAAVFACFFRLQALGGPVYLSQIGYVAAAVGMAAGVLFLDERYAPLTWVGAAVAAVGVILTSRAQAQPAARPTADARPR